MIKISRIVNVLDHIKPINHALYRDPVVTPFIVLFDVEGYEFSLIKRDDVDYQKSFATREEAENAAIEFLKTFKYDAVFVLKNGRIQKLFRSVAGAERYVAEQPHEWTSGNIDRRMHFALNVYGEAYSSTDWEHFHIQFVSFED